MTFWILGIDDKDRGLGALYTWKKIVKVRWFLKMRNFAQKIDEDVYDFVKYSKYDWWSWSHTSSKRTLQSLNALSLGILLAQDPLFNISVSHCILVIPIKCIKSSDWFSDVNLYTFY